MSNKKLVSYISQQLQKGNSIGKIKNYLRTYGYNDREIEKSVSRIYATKEGRHAIDLSPAALITLLSVFIGLIIIAGAIYFLTSSSGQGQLLDLKIKSVSASAKPGEDLAYLVELKGSGSGSDVLLKNELISIETNIVVNSDEGKFGIQEIGLMQKRISVPGNANPGNYILRTIATYNGQRAVATLQVKVDEDLGPETAPPEPPEPAVDPEPQVPEEPIVIPEPKVEEPDDEFKRLTSFETIEQVKNLAKADPAKAAGLCKNLNLQVSRDLCFNSIGELAEDQSYCTLIQDSRTQDICRSNVARILKESTICESISMDSRRDRCYMNFVIDFRDYSVCEKVLNEYLRDSCKKIKQLSAFNQTNLAFYEALLNQTLLSFG